MVKRKAANAAKEFFGLRHLLDRRRKAHRELKKMLPADSGKGKDDGYEELSWDDAIFEVNE